MCNEPNLDHKMYHLKEHLSPLIEASKRNYRVVKNKRGMERMWLPLLLYHPLKQLWNLVILGKSRIKVTPVINIITILLALLATVPALPTVLAIQGYITDTTTYWLVILLVWYLLTVGYTLVQMTNWKNDYFFHIDAYRRIRSNEYNIIEPFLDDGLSLSSTIDYMMRNSGDKAVKAIYQEVTKRTDEIQDEKDKYVKLLESNESNVVMLSDFVKNLSENFSLIEAKKLDFEHLYLLNFHYTIFHLDKNGEELHLLYQYYPRGDIPNKVYVTDANSIASQQFNTIHSDGIYESDIGVSFRVNIHSSSESWIVTFYKGSKEKDSELNILRHGDIIEGQALLSELNFHQVIEAHCNLIEMNRKYNL
ncbi:hypothetical protein HUG15_13695 [Salicibibacter cibarius]|uniref:Uncharacterized protein n=1 Tax=Salicibibacter cibarius TaxID=2743000 RepID=A0A7T7CC12_9BACI|nr:hypothetical protein [Salicibibacter cibarius]QQK76514.1 hypothetical protein HUG15_13695 [Salicibibacter cibarius]